LRYEIFIGKLGNLLYSPERGIKPFNKGKSQSETLLRESVQNRVGRTLRAYALLFQFSRTAINF